MSAQRYIICRPQGGLNDTLNQLQVCLDYAERWDRVVLLDVRGFGLLEKIFHYLKITEGRGERLVLASDRDIARLKDVATFPIEMQGRLETYESRFDESEGFIDVATGVRLTFDLTKDYDAGVLLHHHWGGGIESLRAIRLFRIRPEFRDDIFPLRELQGERFAAAHVRHSDYTTDYRWFLKRILRRVPHQKLFILTDSPEVLSFAASLPGMEVFHCDVSSEISGRPIHVKDSGLSEESLDHEAKRLLSELLTLGMAETFFYSYVKGFPPVKDRYLVSGFTKLCVEFFLHPDFCQEFGNTEWVEHALSGAPRKAIAVRRFGHLVFVLPTVLWRRGQRLLAKIRQLS